VVAGNARLGGRSECSRYSVKVWLAAERDPAAVGMGDGGGANVFLVRIVAMAAYVCKCWKLERKKIRKRRRKRERKCRAGEWDRVVVVVMHVRRSTHVYLNYVGSV
jgi:hypothetical protein